MQKGIKKHTWLYILVAVLIATALISLYYQFGNQPQNQTESSTQETGVSGRGPGIIGGPSIYATLSFSNATGFQSTIYPTSSTIEYVLLPNKTGEFTVSYTSTNNLTEAFFTGSVPVWNVNLANGTLTEDSSLRVTQVNLAFVDTHQVIANYIVTSDGSTGLYVLGLPSTCLSTIVNVGSQSYTGNLTWLDGIIN